MYRKGVFLIILAMLLLINVFVFVFVSRNSSPLLSVAFLDVGQGDAILITGPTGIRVLVDGGPDRGILRALGNEMGFFDRAIDAIIETHPDKDHIGGLTDVFARYDISYFVHPDIPNDTNVAAALKSAAADEPNVRTLIARRGQRFFLGGGAYADVLFPDRAVSEVETNTGSVVLHVVYGVTSFLLTGDAPSGIEGWLVALDGADGSLNSDVLKAGHHGSKTSSSAAFLSAVSPTAAVISAGKGNNYGHPHKEVLERFSQIGSIIFSTAEQGTIRFQSDGRIVNRK